MRLHHIHLGRRNTRIRQRRPNHPLLRHTIRRRETTAATVLVHRGAPHHRQHPMTVPPRIRQPLQQQRSRSLGPAGSVRRGGEGPTSTIGRQGALAAELDEAQRARHDCDAGRERKTALAVPQGLRGQVQRHQRRGTRRIHRHRRPLKTQRVGDPAGHDAAGVPGQEVSLEFFRHLLQKGRVVLVHDSGEYSGAAASNGIQGNSGVFERLPRGLQQQPLLGMHGQGLTRADPEELRIEITRIPQETPLPHIRLPRHPHIRIEQTLHIPAPVHRKIRHRIHPTRHQPPQILRRPHIPRIAAGHPHNGQRFRPCGGQLAILLPQEFGLLQRGPQRPDDFFTGCGHRRTPNLRSRTGQ
ncbi:hypothetical protein STBA_68040 [Streptomyces sp. MP131-18]|nr:hypothetical protein STBA_68040 [Streptomyces sp. MP131-18]